MFPPHPAGGPCADAIHLPPAAPVRSHLDELRARLRARSELLGGTRGPRPLAALESLARRLSLTLTRIEGAGHEPWLERPDTVRAHLRRFVQNALTPSASGAAYLGVRRSARSRPIG